MILALAFLFRLSWFCIRNFPPLPWQKPSAQDLDLSPGLSTRPQPSPPILRTAGLDPREEKHGSKKLGERAEEAWGAGHLVMYWGRVSSLLCPEGVTGGELEA